MNAGVVHGFMRRFNAASLAILLMGCAAEPSSEKAPPSEAAEATPVVTDERTDLVFTWIADGGPQIASSVGEVPDEVKHSVRVQDPSVPPEKRDTSVLYLADLTKPTPNGQYPVKTVVRSEYEAERRAVEEAARKASAAAVAASTTAGGGVPAPVAIPPQLGQSPVIMYATKHCPVCVKARRWLLEQNIPYVEKDVEQDAQAAQALAKKGAEQGVSTRGVPMFEIGGRLLPGFDKAQIAAAFQALPSKGAK